MAEDIKSTTTKEPETESKESEVKSKTKASAKKKTKRNVAAGQVHIQATFNNTIITVTDKNGNVLTSASAGSSGFRGSKKSTAYAAQVASEKAVSLAKQNHNLTRADVYVKGIGLGRDAAIRALLNTDVMVDSIKDVNGIAHGGVRPRKVKRG